MNVGKSFLFAVCEANSAFADKCSAERRQRHLRQQIPGYTQAQEYAVIANPQGQFHGACHMTDLLR